MKKRVSLQDQNRIPGLNENVNRPFITAACRNNKRLYLFSLLFLPVIISFGRRQEPAVPSTPLPPADDNGKEQEGEKQWHASQIPSSQRQGMKIIVIYRHACKRFGFL
jgi:hypothetical protein